MSIMYIRKITHVDKKNRKEYHTFKLIESIRTERGPRQRTILNLGVDFTLPEERWKELANRIEEILTGQEALFPYPEDIENLAALYAQKVIDYQGKKAGGMVEPTEYHRIDIDSIDCQHVRSIGAEYVAYNTICSLGLKELLTSLGFNKPALDSAIGVIAARLIAPSSDRATHIWLKEISAIDELLDADFTGLSQDRVYKTSDMLLKHKRQIEDHLRAKEQSLFNLDEKVILYDLTNTFFEGSGRYNSKAHFGSSKEKRSDCPLVTLGMVVDNQGFPKRTEVFAGNISEPKTLEDMIKTLSYTPSLIVMDAGIATESNILWLKEKGLGYIVVSRRKHIDLPNEMVTVREDNRRLIQAALVKDGDEVILYCHSTDKDMKERGIKNLLEGRFEERLEHIRNSLSKKPKVYEKIIERIGRLRERYRRVSHRYEITVSKDGNKATNIVWRQKKHDKPTGVYCLRSNRVDFNEQELFDIYTMLTDIEDAFRSMKSELGMRPIHHQNEDRTDGHIFITVLAYHILHTIRFRLRSQGINDSWTTIRKKLSTHVRITTTMKRDDGKIIHIRKSTRPEPFHKKIYDALGLPSRPGVTIKTIL